MKLKELYKHRTDFSIIGLTGRTGSGCSQIADLLSNDFNIIQSGLREPSQFTDPIFRRKFEICQNYLQHGNNWEPFDVIEYKKVLLLYIFKKTGNKYFKVRLLLYKFYRESKSESNTELVDNKFKDLIKILKRNKDLLEKIHLLPKLSIIRSKKNLLELHNIFFGDDFKVFCDDVFHILEEDNYFRRTCLLHKISCNIRKSGSAIDNQTIKTDKIYTIAELINTLIKSKKKFNVVENNNAPTKIVIDSLRNSLEITYFKERFSAFYMIATKDILGNSKQRLQERFKDKIVDETECNVLIQKITDLDETEYKNKDFSNGIFTSPNVENCIQKSDYHIFNLKHDQIEEYFSKFKIASSISDKEINRLSNTFLTREEQLLKLVALINQPGLITPSASERNMQIAFTAKLNSGCISRQVGAVITDKNFVAKSIGWNDVAKGHTPCNLRSVSDYINDSVDNNENYSDFEKGIESNLSDYKYKNNQPLNFKNAMVDYFKESYLKNKDELNGKNCSFCFKTIHNHYEGESNQVHTRSLHAEENAMLQLTKFGGLGVEFGILFTTASPCELCSKKAYQLGIRLIYYIDPYPGIAVDQILKGGSIKPIMIPFSGAIGSSYHKLYEPYLSAKDEITMSLEMKDKNIHINQFKNILKKIYPNVNLENIGSIDDIQNIIESGLSEFEHNKNRGENPEKYDIVPESSE